MDELDRNHKWVRLVLDHELLESTFLYWVQKQDGSYKCILKTTESKPEVTSFGDELSFRQ